MNIKKEKSEFRVLKANKNLLDENSMYHLRIKCCNCGYEIVIDFEVLLNSFLTCGCDNHKDLYPIKIPELFKDGYKLKIDSDKSFSIINSTGKTLTPQRSRNSSDICGWKIKYIYYPVKDILSNIQKDN